MSADGKRPLLVWIISIFYFLGSGLSLLVYSGAVPLPFTESGFHSAPLVNRVLTILLVLVNLGGAIALFLLRRYALYLFAAALILQLFLSVWHPPSTGFSHAAGIGVLASSLGLPLLVCLYAWVQVKTGTLT